MRAVVFAGPSLPPSVRPTIAAIEWRPPVRQGDVYRAALTHPAIIAIIDGYFEVTPTAWHKEILWAMAQGIHVYGAASIGALRAAELDVFGMKGVGRIYEMYRDGVLQDDDEVAVLHGPEELGYPNVTEAMVNIRATLELAVTTEVIDLATSSVVIDSAKACFYKERHYERLLPVASMSGRTNLEALDLLAGFVVNSRVDQKQIDAAAILAEIQCRLDAGVESFQPKFKFERTTAWELACRDYEMGDNSAAVAFG
jgi:hypothetical protein